MGQQALRIPWLVNRKIALVTDHHGFDHGSGQDQKLRLKLPHHHGGPFHQLGDFFQQRVRNLSFSSSSLGNKGDPLSNSCLPLGGIHLYTSRL